MIPALGNVFTSLVSYVPGTNAWNKQELMKKLADYVEKDNAHEIEKLLANEQNIPLIVAGLKESPYSLLHEAAAQGKNDALEVMVDTLPIGVWNIHAQESGRTPLMLAAEHGNDDLPRQLHSRVIEYLCACKRMPIEVGREAIDALRAEFGCASKEEVFESIWGKLVNARDHDKNTALLLAVKNNHYLCCRALFFIKANVEAQNNQGESPRSLAQKLPKDSDIHKLLCEPLYEPPQLVSSVLSGVSSVVGSVRNFFFKA